MKYLFTFLLLAAPMLPVPAQEAELKPEPIVELAEAAEDADRPGAPEEGALEGAVEKENVEEPALPLPEWTPEDRKALITGKLVPGKALLGISKFDGDETIAPASSDYDTDPTLAKTNPKEIPAEFLPRYRARQSGQRIIDPQGLLSAQERLDHEHFLSLQAAESPVKVQLVLFDREQIPPSGLNLTSLMEGPFRGDEWTVVVQYYLGSPKRSQIAFSEDLQKITDDTRRLELIRKAVGGSLRQSDPDSQLHSFLISLTNQLYWMEEKVEEEKKRQALISASEDISAADQAALIAAGPSEPIEQAPEDRMTIGKLAMEIAMIAGWAGVAVLSVALLVAMVLVYRRCKVYRFPELEHDYRLGAAHAGGVGPVMKFANPNLSPSAQRSEAMPDYLTKI